MAILPEIKNISHIKFSCVKVCHSPGHQALNEKHCTGDTGVSQSPDFDLDCDLRVLGWSLMSSPTLDSSLSRESACSSPSPSPLLVLFLSQINKSLKRERKEERKKKGKKKHCALHW